MWYCSFFVLFSFFQQIITERIPLIGLFTSNEIRNHSSTLVTDYAFQHFRTIRNLTTELSIQHRDQDILCDMAEGTKLVFDMISQQPRPLAIFSGACQTVVSAIAETAGIYHMTIVCKSMIDFEILESFLVFISCLLDYLF